MKLAAFAIPVFVFAACHVGENTSETVVVVAPSTPETRTCDSPFAVVDLDTLTPCGNALAKGHCFDQKKTTFSKGDVPDCDEAGMICVPDKILLASGAKMKTCKFLGGNLDGACASLLQTELAAHKDEVTQEGCDADERCTPCLDPRSGDNTGTCDASGVHEKNCVGGKGSEDELCCHASGVCMDLDAVPADSRSNMNRDSCSKSSQVCAPTAMADGIPHKCSLLGIKGVCLDVCFATMLEGVQRPARAECGPTEVCLPCLIGKGEGMPGCD